MSDFVAYVRPTSLLNPFRFCSTVVALDRALSAVFAVCVIRWLFESAVLLAVFAVAVAVSALRAVSVIWVLSPLAVCSTVVALPIALSAFSVDSATFEDRPSAVADSSVFVEYLPSACWVVW